MTPFRVEPFRFDRDSVAVWSQGDPRHTNWPVVYVIEGARAAYVGETTNAGKRMLQHLGNEEKRKRLRKVRVVLDTEFNKSVCLDLEAHLIRWLAGDGQYEILNGNEGVIDADYFERDRYRESFREVFEQLREEGVFQRSIPEIENTDLFKLSPFKALTHDQAIAVEDILEGLFADLETDAGSTSVIEGQPGTGKTIVAIFSELFVVENRARLQDFRMGLVVPQQSLRESLKRVFKKTPKLHPGMILSPFEVGNASEPFDLLIVDETHRLNQRANMSAGPLNRQYIDINIRLFGDDDPRHTQLDWIKAQSTHQVLLLDLEQTVRPADLPAAALRSELSAADSRGRRYRLATQMRMRAGEEYIDFIRRTLRGDDTAVRPELDDYDLRFFDDVGELREAIFEKEREHGLARVIAGYAWDWVSKKNPSLYDIELDGVPMRWNTAQKDWISSPKAVEEVGSIHTVQGYDLNYAGVIIGPDLRYDPETGRLVTSREAIRDARGKQNSPTFGRTYDDEDLLEYVRNIYGVLLTRGIRGTFIYVCDPELRRYLKERFRVE